jgi:hypothetical protein
VPEKVFAIREFAEMFLAAWLSAAFFIVARLTHYFGKDPVEPLDAEALRVWKARRRWMLIMELSALPAMALCAATVTWLSNGSTVVAIGSGMVAGGVGFPFLVSAMKDLVRRRISDGGDGA